jgi:SLT domain-containing protein
MPKHNSKHAYHAQKTHKKAAKHAWVPRDPATIPAESLQALRQAMLLEHVPEDQLADLAWLMAQESGGVVDTRNPHSTARGLFQLLKAQYDLNPNGEKSFGNATEECQGGIQYIIHRYKTAAHARAFWQKHHWY